MIPTNHGNTRRLRAEVGALSVESVSEADDLVGTWGRGPRLPLPSDLTLEWKRRTSDPNVGPRAATRCDALQSGANWG